MEIFEKVEAFWQMICQKTAPAWKACVKVLRKVWKVVSTVWSYIYRLRGLLLTAPELICAVILRNRAAHLNDIVSFIFTVLYRVIAPELCIDFARGIAQSEIKIGIAL